MIRKIVFVLIICVVSLATYSTQAKESLANKMFEWRKRFINTILKRSES